GKTAKEIEELGLKAGYTAERIQEALRRVGGAPESFQLSTGLRFTLDPKDQSENAQRIRKLYGSLVEPEVVQPPPVREKFDTSLRDAEDATRRRADAEKRAADILQKARTDDLTGIARVIEGYRQYRAELGLTEKAR